MPPPVSARSIEKVSAAGSNAVVIRIVPRVPLAPTLSPIACAALTIRLRKI
jgi:hypothetical protein